MNKNMICIGCPMGCDLTVEIDNGKAVSVVGNGCAVGKDMPKQRFLVPQEW